MAKRPRKGAKAAKSSQAAVGGKSFKALKNLRARRFSINDSSSLSEDEDESLVGEFGKKVPGKTYNAGLGSESESSLTALSDDDSGSKTGSVFFESDDEVFAPGGKTPSKFSSKKKYPVGTSGKKSIPPVAVDLDSDLDSDSDSDSNSDSNSDSEVDFVKLQAQRKAMKSRPKATKSKPQGKTVKSIPQSRRSSAPKYGRRKSSAALPDDIEFALEFDDDEDEKDEKEKEKPLAVAGDEDLGEDLGEEISTRTKDYTLNSDDDYEIDDNELLATLQADNDMEEFNDTVGLAARHDSVVLWGDDEDKFLREEERFLVNEFENNGFDDEQPLNLQNYESYDADSNQTHLNDSLEFMNRNKPEAGGSDSYEEDEEDEDDDDDFIVFDLLFDNDISTSDQHKIRDNSARSSPRKRSHRNVGLSVSSDDDDDSYLWNYFFSLDESSGDEGKEKEKKEKKQKTDKNDKSQEEAKPRDDDDKPDDDSEELLVDDFFEHSRKRPLPPVSDHEYDSGESTDEDVLLAAKPHRRHAGLKLAKEVLSSKTADYRPPILGTWVAIDLKPFGIIDGLSTRNLVQPARQAQPRKPRIDTSASSDDLALELDELLNISELDDVDETDIQIWRDFNNEKRAVPLGAFRNKSLVYTNLAAVSAVSAGHSDGGLNHTSRSNNDYNKRRYSLTNHSHGDRKAAAGGAKRARRRSSSGNRAGLNIPSRAMRRRASNAQAESEGLRPTKSGLFSETALANVEELLGDDTEILALVHGL